MNVIYPQLDGVKINQDRTLPISVLQAIRKAYDYLAQAAPENATSADTVIIGTHIQRGLLPAANQSTGVFFIETDRSEAFYVVQQVSSANQWVLVMGFMYGLLAARPSDLTTNDVGFLYTATDALDYRWSGSAWVTLDEARGGSSLSTVNRLTKVTAAGVVGQSTVSDDGTNVNLVEPLHSDLGATPAVSQLRIQANALGAIGMLCFMPDLCEVLFDCEWSGTQLIARNASACVLLKNSAKLGVYGSTGLTVGASFSPPSLFTIDLATGDANVVSGVYRKAGVAGVSGTISLAKLTTIGTNGSITVSGGIITGFVNPT